MPEQCKTRKLQNSLQLYEYVARFSWPDFGRMRTPGPSRVRMRPRGSQGVLAVDGIHCPSCRNFVHPEEATDLLPGRAQITWLGGGLE